MSELYDWICEFKKTQKQILDDCRAIIEGHQSALDQLDQIEALRQIPTPAPVAPAPATATATDTAPQPRQWKFLNENGLLSPELSLEATRDPALLEAIASEIHQAEAEAKQQGE